MTLVILIIILKEMVNAPITMCMIVSENMEEPAYLPQGCYVFLLLRLDHERSSSYGANKTKGSYWRAERVGFGWEAVGSDHLGIWFRHPSSTLTLDGSI